MTFPLVRLSEVAEVTVGYVGSMASEYVETGVPFLRSLNVEPYRLTTNDLKFVTPEFHRRIKKSALRPGDVVIVRTGKPGTCAVVPEWLEEANCSDLVVVRCGPAIDPRYLSYWVNSLASHHIDSNLVGAVQQHFNVGAAKEMPVRLPARAEQERILPAIATLDEKIELNRRMNETLEAMAQAIFRDWFIDFGPVRRKLAGVTDPVEIMGRMIAEPVRAAKLAALFPASLGEDAVPEGWCRAPLGAIADVIDCLHAKKPSRTTVGRPYLQLNNIADLGMIDQSDTYLVSEADYAVWTSRIEASPGDCVITNVGRVGAVAQVPAGMFAALGRNMTGIRCKAQYPYPAHLIICLLSRSMKREIENHTDTGTILDALNVKSIPKLHFCKATPEVLGAFEVLARPLREAMEGNDAQARTLAETRDYLLPRLMSGEVRVRDEERLVA